MIYPITVTFCNAAQLARGLLRFQKAKNSTLNYSDFHYLVQAHYPLWHDFNIMNQGLVVDAIYELTGQKYLWTDPGSDIGSCQSQNWILEKYLSLSDDDFWINVDADSDIPTRGWDVAMCEVMELDSSIGIISCLNPPVKNEIATGQLPIREETIAGHRVAFPLHAPQFNLSMFRQKAVRACGGLTQLFESYGGLEFPMYHAMRKVGYTTCYLLDYLEDERGKWMGDKVFGDWKMAHAHKRTFPGTFGAYLKEFHPELL